MRERSKNEKKMEVKAQWTTRKEEGKKASLDSNSILLLMKESGEDTGRQSLTLMNYSSEGLFESTKK